MAASTVQRWQNAPGKKDDRYDNGAELARRMTVAATNRETLQTARRWRSLTYYRFFSGRPQLAQFAFGMARRPLSFSTYYHQFNFTPPAYNVIATTADVYVNRLLRHEVHVAYVPDRGDYSQRSDAKYIEQWVDAAFEETKFWEAFKLMGLDLLCYGSGVLKPRIGLDKKIGVDRVHPDELLYENEDEDKPKECIQRVWASKEDLLCKYKGDKAATAAIEKAQSAFPAFYFGNGSLDCDDVIPLLEGWRLNYPDKNGRHALVVGNYCLEDEEYDDTDFPWETFHFHQLPTGIWGQGISEILLRLNEEIDRLMGAISENQRRCGWPKWLVETNSGVNPMALGDSSGAVVTYQRDKPEQVAPPTTNPEIFEHLKWLIQVAMTRVHISENAVKGEQPKALQSAVALTKYAQIDDANFAELGGRLETGVVNCAYKYIKLAKKVKPDFKMPGRSKQLIKWSKISTILDTNVGLRGFAMSRLPQDIAGRQQLLDSMLANGTISKTIHTKFSQVPDIDGLLDTLNAKQDTVDNMLERIVSGGEYEPPLPFMDLNYAQEAAENKYCLEKDMETPQEILDLLLQWRASVIEMNAEKTTMPAPALPTGAQMGGPPTDPAGFGGGQAGAPLIPQSPDLAANQAPIQPGIQ